MLYAAYGSNLYLRQMLRRCPDAKVWGTATLQGYELLFRGSGMGYLTIEKKKGGSVPLGIFETSKDDEKALDRYEGFPHTYYKRRMQLKATRNESLVSEETEVYIYIMHRDRPFCLPSELYFDGCAIGYKDFGFNPKVLADAVKSTALKILRKEYSRDKTRVYVG